MTLLHRRSTRDFEDLLSDVEFTDAATNPSTVGEKWEARTAPSMSLNQGASVSMHHREHKRVENSKTFGLAFHDQALESAFVQESVNVRVRSASGQCYLALMMLWFAYCTTRWFQIPDARKYEITRSASPDLFVFFGLLLLLAIVLQMFAVIYFLGKRIRICCLHVCTCYVIVWFLAILAVLMVQPFRIGFLFMNDGCSIYGPERCPGADNGDSLTVIVVMTGICCIVDDGLCSDSFWVCLGIPVLYLIFGLPPGWSAHSQSVLILHSFWMFVLSMWIWSTGRNKERMDRTIWLTKQRLHAEISQMKRESCVIDDSEKEAVDQLASAIRWESVDDVKSASERLHEIGWSQCRIDEQEKEIRKEHSQTFGVSAAYLLSGEFTAMAQRRTGKENPSFYELSEAIYKGDSAVGKSNVCPRDGAQGCSYLDTLPPERKGPCTHFLSWHWDYKLLMVQGALSKWLSAIGCAPRDVYLWMCFFVNNQHRILGENGKKIKNGSDNLEQVFHANLLRIGKVVALLDTWLDPSYLKRIWCIFEQYTATSLGIDVRMILPPDAAYSLLEEVDKGKVGIFNVIRSLSNVDSQSAKASIEADEAKVKQIIEESVGFDTVNKFIITSLTKWIGLEVQHYMAELTMSYNGTNRCAQSTRSSASILVDEFHFGRASSLASRTSTLVASRASRTSAIEYEAGQQDRLPSDIEEAITLWLEEDNEDSESDLHPCRLLLEFDDDDAVMKERFEIVENGDQAPSLEETHLWRPNENEKVIAFL